MFRHANIFKIVNMLYDYKNNIEINDIERIE